MINSIHETDYQWYAVRTRSKCEKVVARLLGIKKIQHYLPLQQTIKRYQRKVKKYDKPLITCYVFVRIVRSEYISVLETEHVAGFISFGRQVRPIPDDEIQILRRVVLESDIELEAIPGSVIAGDPVMITAGPLTGMQGTVVAQEGKRRFQIELEKMGFSLLMTIEAAYLQRMTQAK
jgi:transcription antitermination factor NusG